MPTISVALATYNGARFLRAQIESILEQSHPVTEIVVSDDCSTDETLNILRSFKDPRIKVYENEKNLGYVKNFEKACTLCAGEVIALADQDDVWATDKISKLLSSKDGETPIAVFSDARLIDRHGEFLGISLSDKTIPSTLRDPISFKSFYLANCVTGCTLMFEKELLDAALPFPEIIPHDMWLAYVAASRGSLIYNSAQLVDYRQHDSNTIGVSLGGNKSRLNWGYLKKKTKEARVTWQLGRKEKWHLELLGRLQAMFNYEERYLGSASKELVFLLDWAKCKLNKSIVEPRFVDYFYGDRSGPVFDFLDSKAYTKPRYVSESYQSVKSKIIFRFLTAYASIFAVLLILILLLFLV